MTTLRKLNLFVVVAIAGLALAGAGCKKKSEEGGGGGAASGSSVASGSAAGGSAAASGSAEGSGSAAAGGSAAGSGSAEGGGSAATVDPNADKLEIFAKHLDPAKPDVTVTFAGIKVVKAAFDPEKIEGGTAELEVDVTSLSTGVAKRDGHLSSPDYLDAAKFATISIKVDNVKKTGDNAYSADATVNAHGAEKKLPVTFTVADKTADSIRINGEAKFSRLDFGVGKPEADETTKAEMTAKLQVTLKKS